MTKGSPETRGQGHRPPRKGRPGCVAASPLRALAVSLFPNRTAIREKVEGAQRLRGVSCFPCGRAANGFVDFGDGPLDGLVDDLDDAAIERSIAEINEAIRRSAARKA